MATEINGVRIASPEEFRVLALVTEERGGSELVDLYQEATGSESANTLYSCLRRLRDKEGWVRADDGVDGRSRSFVITALGRRALSRSREFYLALSRFGTM